MTNKPMASVDRKDAPACHWTKPGIPSFALQPSLRPLPLPLLPSTLHRFLLSCRPLLTPEEYAQAERDVRAFAEGPGPKLQLRLEARAYACAAAGKHWLSDWWEHFAYLSCRVPLPVKWNIFSTVLDCTPSANRHRRTARLLHAAAEFHGAHVPRCHPTAHPAPSARPRSIQSSRRRVCLSLSLVCSAP